LKHPVEDDEDVGVIYSYDGESVSVDWLMAIDPPDWETNDRIPEGFVQIPIDPNRQRGRDTPSNPAASKGEE
jgi:hypothetical protein